MVPLRLAAAILALVLAPLGALAQALAVEPERETLLITPQEAAAFQRILATTPEQDAAFKSLLDASRAEVRQGGARIAKVLKEYRDLPAEQRTRQAREQMVEKFKSVAPDTGEIRKRLLADARALLTGEQDARWERFEFFLRRERVLHSDSGWGRDRTNLLALAAAAGVKGEPGTPVAELLDQYERDLNRILTELEAAEADLNKSIAEARAKGQDSGPVREKHPFWDVARRLREFNRRSVSRMLAELPPESAAALRALYDRVSLPEALAPDESDEAIRAAPDLPGLSDECRASLRKLVASYSTERARLSDAIASIERAMRDASPGQKVDTSKWDDLRGDRGVLTVTNQGKVKALLTPEQFQAALDAGHRKVEEWRWKWSR